MIKIYNLNKTYKNKNCIIAAINNLNLDINNTGLVFILGKSGSGKTTLINMLSGKLKPSNGDILFNNNKISNLSKKQRDTFRNINIGIVSQDYNLIEYYTVYDNVSLPLKIQKGYSEDEIKDKVDEILDYLGLKDFRNRYIYELSGGQQQRVAIARALIKDPNIILADEPTGNLDFNNSKIIFDYLKKIANYRSVIVVSHDEFSAQKYADRIIKLEQGIVIEDTICTKLYAIDIIDNSNNKKQISFNENNFEYITKFIRNSLMTSKNIDLNIKINEKETNYLPRAEKNLLLNERETNKMSFSDIIRYAYKNTSRRVSKLIVTNIILILLVILMFVGIYISSTNNDVTISNYLYNQDIQKLFVYKNEQYIDEFGDVNSQNIKVGKNIYDDLKKYIPENNIATIDYGNTLLKINNSGNNIVNNVANVNIKQSCLDLLTLNTNIDKIGPNQIILTDYLINKLDINLEIENTIYYNGKKVEIIAFVKTNFFKIEEIRNLKSELNKDKYEFDLNTEYNIIYSCELNKEIPESLNFDYGNFIYSKHINGYLNNGFIIAPIPSKYNKLAEDMSCNNVLISKSFYEKIKNNVTNDKFNFDFLDLYNDKYKNIYFNMFNIYDYYQNGIVVDEIIDCNTADIFVPYNEYVEMYNDYNKHYSFDGYFILGKNSIDNCNFELLENGYEFEHPVIEEIYKINELISNIKSYSLLILIVLITIFTLFIINYFSTSISFVYKSINVKRTLGVTKQDICKIYMIESYIISIVPIAIGTIIFNIIVYYANQSFRTYINESGYKYFYSNTPVLLGSSMILILIILLTSFYQISKNSNV